MFLQGLLKKKAYKAWECQIQRIFVDRVKYVLDVHFQKITALERLLCN